MSNVLPPDISKKLKKLVFEIAEKEGYLNRDRASNKEFMDQLVKHPQIGGVISQYIEKSRVHKYIKDAIINRYSKDKFIEARKSVCLNKVIKDLFDIDVIEVEEIPNKKISLFRKEAKDSRRFIVVGDGTYTKWETALRKVLCYSTDKHFYNNGQVEYLLNLYTQEKKVPQSEKLFLTSTLNQINAKVHFFGEPQ